MVNTVPVGQVTVRAAAWDVTEPAVHETAVAAKRVGVVNAAEPPLETVMVPV